MIDHEFLSPFKQNPWKLFRNTTSETIPPFSILRITGAEGFNGAIRITVAKPNATQATAYMVNGPYAVPAGKDGVCTTLTQAGYIAYDTADGTPAVGNSYGAKNGQWTAKKNVDGFFVCGGDTFTAGVSAVAAIQVSTGGAELIQFVTTEYMGDTTSTEVAATFEWGGTGSVTLHDEIEQFPDIHSGAVGTAVYDSENGYYRIVSSQRVAIFAYALLSGELCPDAFPTPTTADITDFIVLPVGDYVGDPPTAPTAVNRGTIHAGYSGDKVLLRRIDNAMPEPTWEIIAIDKHLVQPATNITVESGNLVFYTRKTWVEACDPDEYGPTTIAAYPP